MFKGLETQDSRPIDSAKSENVFGTIFDPNFLLISAEIHSV